MKHRVLWVALLVWSATVATAQGTLSGTIRNIETKEPLYGAIVQSGDVVGTETDFNGHFELALPQGEYALKVTLLGFLQRDTVVQISDGQAIVWDILLQPNNDVLDAVVVSASQYKRDFKEEVTSVDVISPRVIGSNAVVSLADVVERNPSVQIIDGQANIRSGSGYAYGAGSRVMVMIDEMPLLTAELSDVKWNFIPIENAAQIEIVKGASSVLYGSAALNGVINVRTARPTEKPYTAISAYSGVYDAPKTKERLWWRFPQGQPFTSGVYFAHRQRLNDRLDLTTGFNGHWLNSPVKGADERRIRATTNLRYRPANNDRITYGVNTNIMYHEIGNFFIFRNGYTDNFIHINEPFGRDNYITLNIDPYLIAYDAAKNKHSLRTRYYYINKIRGGNDSPNSLSSIEYQFQRTFDDDMVVTAGINGQYLFARSVLFHEDSVGNLSTQTAGVGAMYAQVDKKFGTRLNTVLGVRGESYRYGTQGTQVILVLRAGLNYTLSPNDYLRTSFGQGYRIPSLVERYIDDALTTEIKVLPNPNLQPESGWNTELGYKKTIRTDNWNGYFDAAAFWMEYQNMTEFVFGIFPPEVLVPPASALDYLGFRSENISQARIVGLELTSFGEATIGKTNLRTRMGYTFTYPADLSTDSTQRNIGILFSNAAKAFIQGADSLQNSILKYRSLHIARLDTEIEINKLTIGVAANYNSFIINVDKLFTTSLIDGLIPGLNTYRLSNTKGDWVFDLRTAVQIKPNQRFHFIVNNLLNREYAFRPGKMNLTRSFNIKYELRF
jgi:outer membrane receptor protein involved in Fe transport